MARRLQSQPPSPRPPLQILLAAPRGFCAGVDRAIKIVELALQKFGAPVYVRHEIVHNRHVVDSLEGKRRHFCGGAGRDPRNRRPCDLFGTWGAAAPCRPPPRPATCSTSMPPAPWSPRCTPRPALHHENGLEIVLIGHAGHPEVVGTLGQLPRGRRHADRDRGRCAARFTPRDPERLAYITQTTLSVDDTAAIVAILRQRFPDIVGPRKEDICYATTNRQEAVKAIAGRCDRLIVVGAPNSSNSLRLVEVAERAGCPKALLVQRAAEIPWDAVRGHRHARHHRRRLGARAAGRRDHRRLPRPLRRRGRERRHQGGAHRLQRAARAARGGREPEPIATQIRARAWPSTPKSPTTIWPQFIASYDLGALLSYKGIAEGVENTNYLVHTEKGPFFLTLYEKRVAPADLPFFLGLMEHLAQAGLTCPTPVRDAEGRMLRALAGRPAALVTFLEGVWIRRPQPRHCSAVGQAMARLHLAGQSFKLAPRQCAGARRLAAALRALPLARRRDRARPRRHHRAGARPSARPTGRPTCRRASSTPTCFPTTCSSSATSCPG